MHAFRMILLSFLVFLQAAAVCSGEQRQFVQKIIYGLPAVQHCDPDAVHRNLALSGVDAVFVPPDRDSIAFYRKRGYRVYVAFNAFGGKDGWKRYPDSVPILAEGVPMDGKPQLRGFGGVCPTHEGWRRERLAELSRWVADLGGSEGIDGVFLDFIRYPGYWESPVPELVDACYCDRCMARFSADTSLRVPQLDPSLRAAWIREHHRKPWAEWKVGVILSFVREARAVLDANPFGRRLALGVFTVPYTAYEHQAALSALFGQDLQRMAEVVDILSPMLYPGLMGKDAASWTARMVGLYREGLAASPCRLWPILQATDGTAEMFAHSLDAARDAGAEAVAVYSFSGMDAPKWEALAGFAPPPNLVLNPELRFPVGGGDPIAWGRRGYGSADQGFFVSHQKPFAAVGLRPRLDAPISWEAETAACLPGERYRFSALFLRTHFENGVYPELRIWGQDVPLNTHLIQQRFQPIGFDIVCPQREGVEPVLRFTNRHPTETFWMAQPQIRRIDARSDASRPRPFTEPLLGPQQGLAIGVYGADVADYPEVKRIGVDAVIVSSVGGVGPDPVRTALDAKLTPIVTLSEDPVSLDDTLQGLLRTHGPDAPLAFYAADEPEIHGASPRALEELYREIRGRFPKAPVTMAVVRPQAVAELRHAADLFLIDPYPVPSMPMIWLSDALDTAAASVGSRRVGAVIQAFGGVEHASWGWPRMPSREEMTCLTYLSLVHGAKAVFYFSWKEAGRTEQGKADLAAVIERLSRLRAWFSDDAADPPPLVRMTSTYGIDPSGRAAVHAASWRQGLQTLLVAVNTLGIHVAADIFVPQSADRASTVFREIDGRRSFGVSEGHLEVGFKPYEVIILSCADF